MTSHIIETVYPQNVTSFFFCRYDDHESLKAKTIIGSIARQLAATLPADSFHGFNFDIIDATAAISFLKSALYQASKYYIVLGGLDECEEVQVKEITETLHELLDCPGLQIKIFWSSRPNVVNWLPLKFRPQSRIILETEENQNKITLDIQKLIENTLEEWLDGEAPQMQINDPALILTIVNHLQEEAQGMYVNLIPCMIVYSLR